MAGTGEQPENEQIEFGQLGLRRELLDAIEKLGWNSPTPI